MEQRVACALSATPSGAMFALSVSTARGSSSAGGDFELVCKYDQLLSCEVQLGPTLS